MADIVKEEVKRRFSRSRASYDRNAEVQRAMAELLLDRFLLVTARREFESVTEIGCGSGMLTDLIECRLDCNRLHLIDLVPEWEEFHRHRAGTDFTAGDAEQIPLPAADLVLSNAALQWAADLPRLFDRIADSLRPGGFFGFSTFGPENLREIAALTGHRLSYRSGVELTELLDRRFEVLARHEEYRTLEFAAPIDVLRHLKATGVTAVGPAHRWTRGKLADFERTYQDTYRNADGRLPLTYHPILFIARKKSEI